MHDPAHDKKIEKSLRESLKILFYEEPLITVSQWADTRRVLSSESSAEPGQWSTNRVEYLRGIMDAFNDPAISDIVCIGNSQFGKALSIDTPIPTLEGWRQMGDIKINDILFDRNGNKTLVIAMSPVMHDRPCYKIIFDDGEKIIADENHRWFVHDRKLNYKEKLLTTKELFYGISSKSGNRWRIDLCRPLKIDEADLPIDPYILGLWLGDGNSFSAQLTVDNRDELLPIIFDKCKNAKIISHDKRRPHVITMAIDPAILKTSLYCNRGHRKKKYKNSKYLTCPTCSALRQKAKQREKKLGHVSRVKMWSGGMHHKLKNLSLIGNKHIPIKYLRAEINQRRELLQGLMDTDGHIKKNGSCEITFKNKNLIENMAELLYSLGIKPVIKVKTACSQNKIKNNYYRITFTAYQEDKIFKMPRKISRLFSINDKTRRVTESKRRSIISIKPILSIPVKCLAVNSPDKTYLAGKGMIPTHNTETINNIIGYCIDQEPCPITVVQPTLEMARTWSKDRFAPMLRDTPALRGKVEDSKSKDNDSTILQKIFPNGNLTISGANSPASLAGRPKRVVIGDDVDRWPLSAGKEGDPIRLLFKRTTAFYNKKQILFSTPTDQHSRIWKAFLETDQRYYFVPCPKCGEYQTLDWKNDETGKYHVKWERDKHGKHLPKTAYYECDKCGAHLNDNDINEMVKLGEWRATKPFNGKAGFSMNEIYSSWVTLAETVQSFLDAKDDPFQLRVWVNTSRGKIFEERGDAPEWERIYMRRERYQVGRIPAGGLLLVAGADVHKDRIEVEVLAYGRGRQSWSVDYRIISGDVAGGGPGKILDEIMHERFPHELGGSAQIRMIAVDAGYETQTVYNWVRKYPQNRAMAVRGIHSLGVILGVPRMIDILVDGKKYVRGMKYWPVGVSVCKSELYGNLRLEKNGDIYPDGYCHFPEYDEEYFKGITAEELHIIARRFEWRKIREYNHPLDARNYARAAASALAIDRYTEDAWKALEQGMRPAPVASGPRQGKKKNYVLSRGITI
jgi:phage terminase large subunit GpA-like protein/intein/homing endonuclease